MEFDLQEQKYLTKWEDLLADEYLHEEERSAKDSQEFKIQLALDKLIF
jgi:hypothetical protein